MKMKKFIALGMAGMLSAATLVGCDKGGATTPTPTPDDNGGSTATSTTTPDDGGDVVVEEDFQQMLTAYLTSLNMSDVAGEMETMRNKELN